MSSRWMSSHFMPHFAVHCFYDSPKQQADDAPGAGCGSAGTNAASVAGGRLHACEPQVPVISLSNILRCPQPSCNTRVQSWWCVWELLHPLSSVKTAKNDQYKNISKHITISLLFSCVQLKELFVTSRGVDGLSFSDVAFVPLLC